MGTMGVKGKGKEFSAACGWLHPCPGVALEVTQTRLMQLNSPILSSCQSKGEGRVAWMLLRSPFKYMQGVAWLAVCWC